MRFEDVVYEMAVPAKKLDIIIWLLTGGKKGKLFVRESKTFKKWYPDHVNCRCTSAPIIEEDRF